MRILKAQVASNKDQTHTGLFHVICPDISLDFVKVTMTSPYYTRNGGGMLAIPEPGSEILIFESGNEYFYLSTIIKPPEPTDGNVITNYKTITKNVYTTRDKPQKVSYTGPYDDGLSIHNRYTPGQIVSRTQLKSRKGKKVVLDDSPDVDYVKVSNEHGDGLLITSETTDFNSARCVELKSVGAQRCVSYQSSYDIVVVDGTEINLTNYSVGDVAQNPLQSGNINITSKNRDINIVSEGIVGAIYLITPKARIQISNDGTIDIQSALGVNINTPAPIQIKSDVSIGLEAPIIDLNTELLTTGAGATTLTSPVGPVTMTGTPIPLNIPDPPRNAYGK